MVLTEVGTTPGYTDGDWSNFVVLQKVAGGYDAWGRPVRSEVQAAGGTVYGLSQTSYDAAGRPSCVVTRMNPAVFGTVTSNACSLGTAAGYGPDRITAFAYDDTGRVTATTSAHGLAEAVTEAVTYTANGRPHTLTDAAGNSSELAYERLSVFIPG